MRIPTFALLALALPALGLAGCDEGGGDTPIDPVDPNAAIASCEGCHTDYEVLKQIATPDTVTPPEGCSGPPPHVEPYDRVAMDGEGFAAFKASTHGSLGCTTCHGGVDSTSDKTLAHSADFVKHPSKSNLETCSGCHASIVDGFENSLHFEGWGQKNSQMKRYGVASFEELPEGIRHGYQGNCETCHASCGSCHVNRPSAGGGGLLNAHSFEAPDMRDQCTACHSSRGGHAYYGVGTGTQPDVHLTAAGYTCTSCHGMGELHNEGGAVHEHRFQVEALPECTSCHVDIAADNRYHRQHIDDFNCHTCHSQDYNTCGSCHVAGEGARIHAHQSFKIALNPIPDEKPYKYATVRRTPAAPDSWSVFGIEDLESFDAKTTFNYTTPHNIQRWTSRTDGAESCYANCHLIQEGDTYRNRHLYLFSSDFLLDWEVSSNQSIVVDGQLPATWGTP